MDWTPIVSRVTDVLSPLLLALLGLLVVKLTQFVNAHVKSTYVRAAFQRLTDAVTDAVKELEQTIVPALKERAADGKLTVEDIAEVRRMADDKVRAYLGARGLSELARVVDAPALEAMIRAKIEAAIHDMRSAPDGATVTRASVQVDGETVAEATSTSTQIPPPPPA